MNAKLNTSEALYEALTQILRDKMIREHLEDYDPTALKAARNAILNYIEDGAVLDEYDNALLTAL